MKKEEVVLELLKRGILVAQDVSEEDLAFLDEIKLDLLIKKNPFIIDKIFLAREFQKNDTEPNFEIVFNYTKPPIKREISHFIAHFEKRFEALKKILMQREELQNIISINRLFTKAEKEQVAIIGMVYNKQITKNDNIILEIEDKTGIIKVLVNKSKPELYREAKDIVLDEIIGITGIVGKGIIFVNNIYFPEVSTTKELKKTPEEVYALFLSDTHVGNKNFLKEEFMRFIDWLNLKIGDDNQKNIASKVKYIFITGDLVEGVGYYPGQENEIDPETPDIKTQYSKLAYYLRQIPNNITIFICAGDHDAMRLAQPQAPLYEDFAEDLYKIPNLKILSNPSIVTIHKTKNFSGIDVMLYHGYSFIYYSETVESIRNQGGMNKADLIMKFLLRRRHLSPTHSASLYVPDPEKDYLVIERVPDIITTGHIHKITISNYRNVTLLNSSCWLPLTDYQEKRGINPQPARILCMNLQTRETKVIKF